MLISCVKAILETIIRAFFLNHFLGGQNLVFYWENALAKTGWRPTLVEKTFIFSNMYNIKVPPPSLGKLLDINTESLYVLVV